VRRGIVHCHNIPSQVFTGNADQRPVSACIGPS
jgi:hypothetical protein